MRKWNLSPQQRLLFSGCGVGNAEVPLIDSETAINGELLARNQLQAINYNT